MYNSGCFQKGSTVALQINNEKRGENKGQDMYEKMMMFFPETFFKNYLIISSSFCLFLLLFHF